MGVEPLILWLSACRSDCQALVGGKAVGLGLLLREGLQVPPGFVVTTRAFREHIERHRLGPDIERLLGEPDRQHVAEEIRGMFESSRLSAQLEDEVSAAHQRLCGGAESARPMAIRSSATAEDLADASFAGQQETYLWIIGGQEVLSHVVRCWASLYTSQALAYRAHRNIDSADLAMGVVVQCMVPAEAAGVMLTIDPVNGDRSAIVIEAAYGLGMAVVNGEVTPDRFCVDKVLVEIRSRSIGAKTIAYRFDPAVQGTRLEPVSADKQQQPCLTDVEVIELASLGKRMELALGRPQDMEWAIGPGQSGPREVFLLQARPETIWSQKQSARLSAAGTTVMDRILQTMVGSHATIKGDLGHDE
jgi:pyruvate,water dikinase